MATAALQDGCRVVSGGFDGGRSARLVEMEVVAPLADDLPCTRENYGCSSTSPPGFLYQYGVQTRDCFTSINGSKRLKQLIEACSVAIDPGQT